MERFNIYSEFLRDNSSQKLRWKNKTRVFPQKRLFKCIQNICLSFCDRLFFLSCNRSMIVYNHRNVHSLCCLHERPWHKSRSIENNEIRFFRGDNIFECRYKFRTLRFLILAYHSIFVWPGYVVVFIHKNFLSLFSRLTVTNSVFQKIAFFSQIILLTTLGIPQTR